MKFKVKDFIFTDKTKAWKELINKAWDKFFMLHLEVQEVDDAIIQANEHGKWISKYYTTDESKKLSEKIKIGQIYIIEYSQSWIYKNIVSIMDLEGKIII